MTGVSKRTKQELVGAKSGMNCLAVVLLVLFLLMSAGTVQASAKPAITAKSFVLMEATSGQVLYANNEHERRHQASTTKITTAIVALERGKLTDQVKISKHAAETPESAIWLEEGEQLTLEQLMYALMLFSANDAASAIAEHIAGSEAKFAELMNSKAQAIGAKDSHYVNPHGLDAPNHYTSAFDLALLARYGLTKVPGFAKLVSTQEKNIPWAGHPYERVLRNRNKLLQDYPGADGVKTGFTDLSGRCLVGSATRQGMQLIAVVLDSPNMFQETASLLDWGFANFQKKELVSQQKLLGTVPVTKGLATQVTVKSAEDFVVALRPGDLAQVKIELELPKQIEAPVTKGQKLGIIKISIPGEAIRSIYLVSDQDVARKGKWQLFWEYIKSWLSSF